MNLDILNIERISLLLGSRENHFIISGMIWMKIETLTDVSELRHFNSSERI